MLFTYSKRHVSNMAKDSYVGTERGIVMGMILRVAGQKGVGKNRFKGMGCRIFFLSFLVILGLASPTYATSESMVDPNWKAYTRVSGISGSLNSIGSDTLNNLMTLWAEGFRKQYPNLKIQIEDAYGIFNILFRSGDGHQRHNDITLLDMIFYPFFIDRYISFQKVKKGIVKCLIQSVKAEIHAIYRPVGCVKDPVCQVMPDKTIYTKY